MFLFEFLHRRGKKGRGGNRRSSDDDFALLETVELLDLVLRAVDDREGVTRPAHKNVALRRKRNFDAVTLEELVAELVDQPLNQRRHRRLRQAECLGRLGKALYFGHFEEDSELVQRHISNISYFR